jgi:hypothetical protein
MGILRRRLRSLAAAWVLFQAMALSALVPPSCCLGHRNAPASTDTVSCHGAATAHCAAPAASNPPCRMHQAQGGAHEHSGAPAAKTPPRECAMRAACGGQAAALFAALTQIAVVHDSISVPAAPSTAAPPVACPALIPQFQSPDAPPPRV